MGQPTLAKWVLSRKNWQCKKILYANYPKFKNFSDVTIIPDVTKKADSSTKAEFEELITGCDIPIQELKHNLERTNR